GVTSTGRYPASCPVKPGLSSSAAFRRMQPRLSVLLDTFFNYTLEWRCCPAFFRKTGSALLSQAFVRDQIPAVSRCRGKLIATLILGMSVMSLDPVKRHTVRLLRRQQALPQIHVLYRLILSPLPVLLNPSFHPVLVERVHHILGIRID